jgi:hypothetical protein
MSSVNPLGEEVSWPPESTPEAEPEAIQEPVAEAEEKPATSIDVEPEKPKDDPETKYRNVQAALREERREKAALKAQIEEFGQKFQSFESLKKELEEQRTRAKVEAEQAKLQEDPVSYFKEQLEAVKNQQEQLATQTVEQQQVAAREAQFLTAVSSQVSEYKAKVPDYDDAFRFAHDYRLKELEILGVPPEHREQMFIQESFGLAHQAMQQGRNPGELVYEIAKHWGYRGKSAPKSEATIERIAEGQKASQSLTGGKTATVSVKDIEAMSDDEFDKYWREMEAPTRRR